MSEDFNYQPAPNQRESLAKSLAELIESKLQPAIDDLQREAALIEAGDRPGPLATPTQQAEVDCQLDAIEDERALLSVISGALSLFRRAT